MFAEEVLGFEDYEDGDDDEEGGWMMMMVVMMLVMMLVMTIMMMLVIMMMMVMMLVIMMMIIITEQHTDEVTDNITPSEGGGEATTTVEGHDGDNGDDDDEVGEDQVSRSLLLMEDAMKDDNIGEYIRYVSSLSSPSSSSSSLFIIIIIIILIIIIINHRSMGCDVHVVSDPKSAIQMVMDGGKYCLILLDVEMPSSYSGFDVGVVMMMMMMNDNDDYEILRRHMNPYEYVCMHVCIYVCMYAYMFVHHHHVYVYEQTCKSLRFYTKDTPIVGMSRGQLNAEDVERVSRRYV